MDRNQLKETIKQFAKQAEVIVEQKLGDRSQIENQVKGLMKNLESSFQSFINPERPQEKSLKLKVKTLENFKGDLPAYESVFASGFDVRAQLSEPLTLNPGQRSLVPTGLSFEIPLGYEIQARPRSGLAIKKGLSLVNTPGTIDADYRGEVKIILINLGGEAVTIESGERIAQLVLCPVVQAELIQVETLNDTTRGSGGFGSTGV